MVWLNPRYSEEEIEKFYNDNYYLRDDISEGGYDDYALLEEDLTKTYARIYREISPHLVRRGRVLDIGCGHGYFLSLLREDFDECVGIDISQEACRKVAEKGMLAVRGNFESVDVKSLGSFDLILMTDFLEHVYNLRECMEQLRHLVEVGTLLVVVTPNYNSWLRRILGRNWVSFKIPEHVNYFTPETIKKLLTPRHFKILHNRQVCQYASGGFVSKRVEKVNRVFGRSLSVISTRLRLTKKSFCVPSGNVLVLAIYQPNTQD